MKKLLNEKLAKTRWSLVPWEQFKQVGDVFTLGATKYGDENWKTLDVQIYKDALMRHVISYMEGDKIDESGLDTLSHVIANALILRWFENDSKV